MTHVSFSAGANRDRHEHAFRIARCKQGCYPWVTLGPDLGLSWWWDPPGSTPSVLSLGGGDENPTMLALWNATTGQPLELPVGIRRAAQENRWIEWAFRPGGLAFLIHSSDGTVRLWDATTGRPLGPPLKDEGKIGTK